MIKCLAIDDEYLALEVIENYIQRIPFLQLTATYITPVEALPLISAGDIDLLFLDIAMPDMSGLEFLATLQKPPLVILTTAFPQFALEGFEADVVDYLIKPIFFDRFLKAIQKAQNRLQKNSETPTPDYIFIKSEHRLLRVNYDDILYIEGKKDYVALHTSHQSVDTLLTLSGLLEKLPSSNFLRVHRSFIIALNKITSIERNHIYINRIKIPIGDLYRDELFKKIS